MDERYFKPVKKDTEATLTKNGDFYAVTTHPRSMPLHKCIDNYVKERESNGRIHKVGNVYNDSGSNGDVYDTDGISPTILTGTKGNMHKIIERDIKKVGSTNNGQGGATYGTDGISPCLYAGDLSHNGGINIIEKENSIKKIGSTNGHQSGEVYSPNGLSRTLCCTDWKAPVKIATQTTENSDESREVKNIGRIHNYQRGNVMSDEGLCQALTTCDYKDPLKIATNTSKGYDEVYPNDGIRLAHPTSTKARGRTQKNGTGTLACSDSCDWGTLDESYRIRRLTPVECERLQAFPDNWTQYGKDDELISDTQRYKCIGNAVTTTVITHIINEMFDEVFEDE